VPGADVLLAFSAHALRNAGYRVCEFQITKGRSVSPVCSPAAVIMACACPR
jgi:hypothetical protein